MWPTLALNLVCASVHLSVCLSVCLLQWKDRRRQTSEWRISKTESVMWPTLALNLVCASVHLSVCLSANAKYLGN